MAQQASTDRPVRATLRSIKAQYAHGEERPLGSFAVLMGVYGTVVTAGAAYIRHRRIELPERPAFADLGLVTVATYRLARLLAKDPVTSPIRAPFTRFEGQSGEAELSEEVVGTGPRKAVGELVSCPFCLAQWVATILTFGLIVRPRETRLAASVFSVVAVADALQFGHSKLQETTD